jgi:hypothetical protein
MFASQQSVNAAFGQITKIDYSTGDLIIQSDSSAKPAVVEINDPKGRFGRAQSPDDRFSVDDANPTIHAGTGYPMCVPRTDPGNADDPLCPQQNRPKFDSGQPHGGCRNFTDGNLPVPASGDLSAPADGQTYCTQFVMPEPPQAGASTDGPDARQQAPFEVGDWVTYSGTLMPSDAKHADPWISAHTIIDDVGIYTESLTQPAYISIDAVSIGTADPNARAAGTLIDQEAVDRIVLVASTTDVETPVDAYLMDVDPKTGAVSHRWITPMAMTGRGPTGGIITQLIGPQPQRIRLRAPRAPLGLLSQPTRNIEVVQRSLCMPDDQSKSSRVDACLNNAPTAANGLTPGKYFAPIFDYIFPENTRPGDPPVAYDFWHLPFLRYGEGADHASGIGPSVGPLEPAPW